MSAPKEINELVERFERNINSYKSPEYNETQLRNEFINPFFEALGWDVYNKSGYAEPYKDVIHEYTLKVGDTAKAPDYCFRIGGTRKFFVETKKPAVNIRHDPSPAYQLRRYAWSAKLPLSILTDFEEFSVYDCRGKPQKTDKAGTARTLYIGYRDYPQKWEEIASIFSRDAILKGSFDKYVRSAKRKKGTAEVDEAFLAEIEKWRTELARNLALRNRWLTQRELNYAVQATIDRIIFLRICEDRGIENYGRLMALQNGANIYRRLMEYFTDADAKYNSGLFHFSAERGRKAEPDRLTPKLEIDDKVLKDIIKNLYYPDCPYEFSVLPADILGQVYEQFLGKVIRLTKGHRAVVDDKPEVKKAGGVYYTPTYIVDYIVSNTVGKLLEGKRPGPRGGASKLKILDPACGSGSFLIAAYRYLLDWHRDRYVEEGPKKHKNRIYRVGENEWRLTTAEKKRILLNNIYGVDIDPQAIEVTKLSLLLKVLEGENEETINKQLKFFRERALPDLSDNIKCGNSLIGPDFYQNRQMNLLDDEEILRINAFDWDSEFPDVFKEGGFDAVIGNPPYVRIQSLKQWAPLEAEYYKNNYISAGKGNFDIYVVFAEKGYKLLNKNGILGYILPHKFFQAQFANSFREFIKERKAIKEIVHFGSEQVFENVTTYTCLLFLDRKGVDSFRYVSVFDLSKPYEILSSISSKKTNSSYEESVQNLSFFDNEWHFLSKNKRKVLDKLRSQETTLGDVTRKIFVGLQTSADKIYVLEVRRHEKEEVICYSRALAKEIAIEKGFVKPFLMGKDVHRYTPPTPNNVVVFPYNLKNGKAELMTRSYIKENFPKGWKYLSENKKELENREKGKMKGEDFYAYIYPKNLTEFEATKILTPEIAYGCQMSYDKDGGLYHTTKVYGFAFKNDIKESDLYYLGILNSTLLWFFLTSTGYTLRGGYFTFKTEYLKPFPVRTIDFNDSKDKSRHDKMVELVSGMLDLHKRLDEARTGHERTALERRIADTDSQIDRLVYELYDLTEDEIKIVEESGQDNSPGDNSPG